MSSFANSLYNAACVWRPAVIVNTGKINTKEITVLTEDTAALKMRIYGFATTIFGTSVYAATMTITFAAYPLASMVTGFVVTFAVVSIFQYQTESSLTDNAISLYEQKTTIPRQVLSYLAKSPSALAKLIEKNPNIDLNKTDNLGRNLLYWTQFTKTDNSASLKLLIDKFIEKNEFNADLFMKITKVCKSSDPIAYIFEKKAIKSTDLTEDQQHECLNALCDSEKNLHLLISNGFDINAKNKDGQTILLKTILDEGEVPPLKDIKENPRIPLLLKWGAELPNLLPSQQKVKVRRFLDTTQNLRKKAKKAELPDEPFSVGTWNLLKPAIKDSATYTDGVNERIVTIATLFLMSLGLEALPLLAIIGLVITQIFEHSRATKALNELAIKRFKNDFFHSSQTSEYIVKQPSLVKQLIDSGADLSKPDVEGNTLLDAVLDLPDSNKNKPILFQKIFDSINTNTLQNYDKEFYCEKILKQIPLGIYQHALRKGWFPDKA